MRRIGICWASLESKDGAEIVFEEVNDDEEEEDVVVLVGAAVLEEGAGELLGGGVDSRIQPAPMLLKRRRMLCIMVARAATMEARGAAGPHASERARAAGNRDEVRLTERPERPRRDGSSGYTTMVVEVVVAGVVGGGVGGEGARVLDHRLMAPWIAMPDERESRGECAGV